MAALKFVPHSATDVIFGAQAKEDGGKDEEASSDGDEGEQDIQPKDFIWDQFLKYLATAIALLTALDVTVQFLRGGGLDCFIPSESIGANGTSTILDATRDQASYVNAFCFESISQNEYYTVFILIQGLFLVAPNYLWASLFGGHFDFFFGLVKQLDRLRSRKTGEYRHKNLEIVHKLENEFSEDWKWFGIFPLYIVKLVLQLFLAVVSIIMNAALFPQSDFNFVFDCPESFSVVNASRPDGWTLDFSVKCVYPSFRILSKIQIANYLLLVLFALTAIYGLLWCAKRHKHALGYKEIALFAFASSLWPEVHVFPKLWKRPLSPGIRSDLDFLLMRLFRADSGHGKVFKDILVDKELNRRVEEDHEQLYLISEAIKDQSVHQKLGSDPQYREGDIKAAFFRSGFQMTLRKPWRESDAGTSEQSASRRVFSRDPDYPQPSTDHIATHILGRSRLGNYQWEEVAGIRDRLYGFMQFGPKDNSMAYDICFGTIGYSLILARAFKEVTTVNFHPHYRNEEEVVQMKSFHTNYTTITFQENIFAQKREDLLKFDEAVDSQFCVPEQLRLPDEPRVKKTQFIVVGPFTDKAKRATVNLHLERFSGAEYFDKGATLLTVRPLMIESVDVSRVFCKFEPPEQLFSAEEKNLEARTELEKSNIKLVRVGDSEGIPVACGKTHCIFEFVLYEYVAIPHPAPPPPPPLSEEEKAKFGDCLPPCSGGPPFFGPEHFPLPGPSANPGSIALVLPGSMFPMQSVLQIGDIERFLSGDASIQLSVVRGFNFVLSNATEGTATPTTSMHPGAMPTASVYPGPKPCPPCKKVVNTEKRQSKVSNTAKTGNRQRELRNAEQQASLKPSNGAAAHLSNGATRNISNGTVTSQATSQADVHSAADTGASAPVQTGKIGNQTESDVI